jgi:predicted Rdx family selenoprotein
MRDGGGPECWRRSIGGGGLHAAKLWQRKEEEAKGEKMKEEIRDEVEGAREDGHQIQFSVPL